MNGGRAALLLLPRLRRLEYLNDHDILTRIFSLFIFYPIISYIWDGFKYSDNEIIVKWQIYNFIFVSIILILFFLLFLPFETIYCSDGSEDPHKKIIDKGIAALSKLGDSFGDGVVAGAAVKGIAKLMPKTAPLGAKVAAIGLGAAAGVIGKRMAQSAADAGRSNPGSGSSSSNTSTNTANTNNPPVNSKAPTGSNNMSVNSDTPTNTANNNINLDNFELDGASPPFFSDLSLDQYLIISPNEEANSIFSMFFSDNPIEVIISGIYCLNIITLLAVLLLVLCLISNLIVPRSGDREIELKWLSYLFSEYYYLKIKNYIYYIIKIYSKSLKINILIIILVIIFTLILSIYFLNIYIQDLEHFSSVYLEYIKNK